MSRSRNGVNFIVYQSIINTLVIVLCGFIPGFIPLNISVQKILQAPSALQRFDFASLIDLHSETEETTGLVTGQLLINRLSDECLTVSGNFKAPLSLTCHRCGKPFAQDLVFEASDMFTITEKESLSLEVEDTLNPLGDLDVSDWVRQQLLLSLPAFIWCGCEEPSGSLTPTTSEDPRWAALKDLNLG
jgi:uncharacterized metal-binding protein YceD (DUF177 family)